MQADNNLAPGVNDSHPIFNQVSIERKECDECKGTGQIPEAVLDWSEMDEQIFWHKCEDCNGEGTVPKTDEEILNERESKHEPKNL